jgi:streptomycin 6-kinase
VAAQHAADLARTAGRATAALHAAAVPARTPVHGAARETGVLERWLALLTPHAPALAGRVTARAAPVAHALLDVSAAVPVPLHRDLHDGQILVDASGAVALLDLDTLAAGEAALDVANLLVHLELAALQGRCTPERAAAAGTAFLDGYGEPPPSDRLVAHADAARLRLVCVHAFRPAPEGLIDALVERLDAPAPGVDAR